MENQYSRYIARKRARFSAFGVPVNIPWGTPLEVRDGFIYFGEQPLCTVTSDIAYAYFTQDDDGRGLERGKLLEAILARLRPTTEGDAGQPRSNRILDDSLRQKYRRPEHEDYWIWNYDFFNAPVEDLRHIANLIGAK